MLSVRRDRTARICQHITLSTANLSQGLTAWQPHKIRIGTAAETDTVISHNTPPASRSPLGETGKARRKDRSSTEISFPMAATG
jgi:hypothetical protein